LADFRDGFRAALAEVLGQRFEERLIENMTCTLRIPAKVSRHPLRELSVLLSLDDLIGHYVTSCFVGRGNRPGRYVLLCDNAVTHPRASFYREPRLAVRARCIPVNPTLPLALPS